jgi:hypothetical protein
MVDAMDAGIHLIDQAADCCRRAVAAASRLHRSEAPAVLSDDAARNKAQLATQDDDPMAQRSERPDGWIENSRSARFHTASAESGHRMCKLSAMRKLCLSILVVTVAASCSQHHPEPRACTPPLKAWGEAHPHLGAMLTSAVGLDQTRAMYFKGKRVSLNELSTLLQQTRTLNPTPGDVPETGMGVPCATLDKVRDLMNARLTCEKGGHCDEGMPTVWRDLPYPGWGIP